MDAGFEGRASDPQKLRLGLAWPWFAHHLKVTPEAFDFDICVPVSAPVTAVGRVEFWQRPVLRMVRTVYHGTYEGLGDAWNELDAWIKANGLKTAGDLYECYVVGPESTPDPVNWRTELSRPISD